MTMRERNFALPQLKFRAQTGPGFMRHSTADLESSPEVPAANQIKYFSRRTLSGRQKGAVIAKTKASSSALGDNYALTTNYALTRN